MHKNYFLSFSLFLGGRGGGGGKHKLMLVKKKKKKRIWSLTFLKCGAIAAANLVTYYISY